MPDTIADVVVKVSTDLGDAQGQLTQMAAGLGNIGSAAETVAGQLKLFSDAMSPHGDAPGQLNQVAGALGSIPGPAQSAAVAVDALKTATESYSPAAQAIIDQQTELDKALKESKETLEELEKAHAKGAVDWATLERAEKQVVDATHAAGRAAEGARGLFGRLASGLSGMIGLSTELSAEILKVGAGFLGLQVGGQIIERIAEAFLDFAKEASEAATHVEQLHGALEEMYGSSEAASGAIEEAAVAAVDLTVAVEPALNMLQQMAVYGVKSAEDVRDAITAAANAAALTGRSFDQTSNALLRLAETGMASTRSLRQLGIETKDLAAALGVDVGRVQEAMQGLDFDDRMKAAELAMEKFKDAAKNLDEPTIAATTNMNNAWHEFLAHSGKIFNEFLASLKTFATYGLWAFDQLAQGLNILDDFVNKSIKGWQMFGEELRSSISDLFDHKSALERDAEAHEKAARAAEEHKQKEAELSAAVEKSGGNYREHVKDIDQAAALEKSAVNQQITALEGRRRSGAISAQEELRQKGELESKKLAIDEAANAKKMALDKPKGSKAEDEAQLTREAALLKAKGAEDALKTETDIQVESTKAAQAATKVRHEIQEAGNRTDLDMARSHAAALRQEGQISAEQLTALQHTSNAQQLTLDQQAARDRASEQRATGANAIVVAADLAKGLAAADSKFKAAEQETDDKAAEQRIRNEQTIAESVLHARTAGALAEVDLARTSREAVAREFGISAATNRDMARAENEQRLQIQIDGIAAEKALAIKKGADPDVAGQQAREKSLAAHRAWAKDNLNIDENYFNDERALARDALNAASTAAGARDASERSLLETQRATAAADLTMHRITFQEKLALDQKLDEAEDELARRKIQREMLILYLTEGIYGPHKDRYAQLQAALSGLDDQRAARAAKNITDFQSALESALGIEGKMTAEVATHLAQTAAAYRVLLGLQEQGKATANDLDDAYRNMLKSAEDAARAQQGYALIVNRDGQEQMATLNQILMMRAKQAQLDWAEQIRLEGFGSLIGNLGKMYDQMWGRWAAGLADAITQGKRFGDIMYGVLKQMEKQIVEAMLKWGFEKGGAKLMEVVFHQKKDEKPDVVYKMAVDKFSDAVQAFAQAANKLAGGGPTVGGGYSPIHGGASREGGDATQVVKNQTQATQRNTMATTAAVGASVAMVGGLIANITGNKTLAVIMEALGTALSILTTVMLIKAGIPFAQEGGLVQATGAAVIHQGEVVANAAMLANIGAGGARAMQGIGDRLAAGASGGGGTVSFDGAVFHGVPDQRYVSSIMDTAVRGLRNSSRTWAFNPTGS